MDAPSAEINLSVLLAASEGAVSVSDFNVHLFVWRAWLSLQGHLIRIMSEMKCVFCQDLLNTGETEGVICGHVFHCIQEHIRVHSSWKIRCIRCCVKMMTLRAAIAMF